MSQKNCLSALGALVGILALIFAVPSVSHATASAHRADLSRDRSPGIVLAENDQTNESADSESDGDSKDSDDETTAEDQDDTNDQTEQQSAGNAQVNPQFQNGDNDANTDEADEARQAQMNPYPQQVNPYQANPYQ